MRGPAVRPVVIAAGGTGGHFFPAEALASELLSRGHRVALMTDARSGAMTSSVFAGLEQFVLSGAGLAGRGMVRGMQGAAALASGVLQARRILRKLNAAAVVGFGGYPSVAPILGAQMIRRRPAIILHEQNAVLGRANRFLAGRADRVVLSFAATERVGSRTASVVIGNPVRPAIKALVRSGYSAPDASVSLLVLGGSLGARVFSDVVPVALQALPIPMQRRIHVVQQCRPEDLDRVRAAYDAAGINAELAPFFADVAEKLRAAHIVIARAGASTVTELAVAGRPSILVPLPNAIDDHQSANARALAIDGGAWVMPQPAFTAETLSARIMELLHEPQALVNAATAARNIAKTDASERLADLVERLMRQEVRS